MAGSGRVVMVGALRELSLDRLRELVSLEEEDTMRTQGKKSSRTGCRGVRKKEREEMSLLSSDKMQDGVRSCDALVKP
eukprot:3183000-Rhodomonas_salina.2